MYLINVVAKEPGRGSLRMLDECFNRECGKRLKYLRDGRVIRTMRPADSTLHIEHFWLCGSCYSSFDFAVKADGPVALCSRKRGAVAPIGPFIDYLVA